MNALQAFNAGDLEEALKLAKAEVKTNPTDIGARCVLCEMFCFHGELERADKQLETVMMQDPQSSVVISLFRQQIRAETWRQECFREGRAPELLSEADENIRAHLDLLLSIREENLDRARELVGQIDESRPKVSGECDGKAFDDLRDLDDSVCSFFEVLTSTGKYYWIPFNRVESVEFHKPERPRDLMWRRAHMIVAGGPDGEVFVPALYWRSVGDEDRQFRLGRATDWLGGEEGPALGQGQRMFLLGEEDKTLMEIGEMTFADPMSVRPVDAGEQSAAPADNE